MSASSEPLNIALIEDSEGDADLIQEILKETGLKHRLTWLSDGEKAVQYFEAGNEVDFILLDLNLPRFSGHQLLDFFKKRSIMSKTTVVVLTGSSSPIDKKKAKENGVVCYLIKPMTVEEMDKMAIILKEIFLGEKSCNC